MTTNWLVRRDPGPYTEFRLFCFPYAGAGAAAYHRWHAAAPASVHVCAVEQPGRGTRVGEPAQEDFSTLVRDLADRFEEIEPGPFAFFGHSMGGLVAYELTRELRERGSRGPMRLVVSASAAPGTPRVRRSLAGADDAAVCEELRDLGGTPEWVLDDEDLMAMALPAVRADYAALDSYRPRQHAPVDVPITVLGGRDDPIVPPEHLEGWRRATTAGARTRLYPGGHFYLHDHAEHILASVESEVSAGRSRDAPGGSR